MSNPTPITRARRIEMRRKETGYAARCFYCPEADIFCFEIEHPVTHGLDKNFKRVVCRNCHRKLEARRDLKGLTKNGQHWVDETEGEAFRRFLSFIADDLETIAEATLATPPNLLSSALRQSAASIRRKLQSVTIA